MGEDMKYNENEKENYVDEKYYEEKKENYDDNKYHEEKKENYDNKYNEDDYRLVRGFESRRILQRFTDTKTSGNDYIIARGYQLRDNAQRICQDYGGDLASLSTKELLDYTSPRKYLYLYYPWK